MTTEKHDPWALLAAARDHMHHPFALSGLGFADLRARIDAALAEWEVKERVATVTIGNGNGSACTTCNVTGVDTGVVIDTLPPIERARAPMGKFWLLHRADGKGGIVSDTLYAETVENAWKTAEATLAGTAQKVVDPSVTPRA